MISGFVLIINPFPIYSLIVNARERPIFCKKFRGFPNLVSLFCLLKLLEIKRRLFRLFISKYKPDYLLMGIGSLFSFIATKVKLPLMAFSLSGEYIFSTKIST